VLGGYRNVTGLVRGRRRHVFSAEQDAYDGSTDADVNPAVIESVHADRQRRAGAGPGSSPGLSPDGR